MTIGNPSLPQATRTALIALIALIAACQPTPTDRGAHYFETQVAPLLQASCATCHGLPTSSPTAGPTAADDGLYQPTHHRDHSFYFFTDPAGAITDLAQARRQSLRFINTVEDGDFSTLLRKPLATTVGGLPHQGGDLFGSAHAQEAQILRHWIALEAAGGEDPPPSPSARESIFLNRKSSPSSSAGIAPPPAVTAPRPPTP